MTNAQTKVVERQQEKVAQKTEELEPVTIVWRNVGLFAYLHATGLYGVYLAIFEAKVLSLVWVYILSVVSIIGVTAGAHRLWAHRTYKARRPLRVYLALANAIAFQNSIWEWSRDHRAHHKFSETNGDPHNAKRGFLFSHMGWLVARKHEDVVKKGASIDMSDLLADPVVYWQKTFYVTLVLIMCWIMPMYVAVFLWDEKPYVAVFVCDVLRYLLTLHGTWFVNSAAHLYGDKPYDKNINPADNTFVSIISTGEGFHNYHHTFPWDYAASEWGWQRNLTKFFIDTWATLGLAYDLKRVPREIVNKRRKYNGDGSAPWYDEESFEAYHRGSKVL